MKKIIIVIGLLGLFSISFATGYFVMLYKNLTQLIFVLGSGGLFIFLSFVYIYNWMIKKDEDSKEKDKAIDMTRDYVRDVENKIEKR